MVIVNTVRERKSGGGIIGALYAETYKAPMMLLMCDF